MVMSMTNIERARPWGREFGILLALAGAAACGDKNNGVTAINSVSPTAPVVVGAAEVIFTRLSATDVTARLVLASSLTKLQQLDAAKDTVGDLTSLSSRLVVASEFAFAQAGSAPVRFIRATFAVQNAATGSPLFVPASHNLTFIAVGTPNTLSGTPVRVVLRLDGTPAPIAIAQQLLATDITAITADGTLTTLPPPVHVTIANDVLSAITLPSDASHLFPFGFLVRGLADFDGAENIPPPANGAVTFAFRLPLTSVATGNASTMSVLFLLVNGTVATP